MTNSQSQDVLQQVPLPALGDQLESVPTETPTSKEAAVEGMSDEGKAPISPLEIHSQTTVIRRRGFSMFEDVIPAFIKISTGFKTELKNIDGTALKVWIYLALSINRNTEQAHPGIRTIAQACGIGQNTAIAAVRDLERLGLLLVNRKDRKYNIYEIPAYVSANARTASKPEAVSLTASGDDETASQSSQTASEKPETASVTQRLNQINQIDQSKPESTTAREISAKVFKAYEEEIGLLTPSISNAISDYLDDLKISSEWIIDAIHEAARQNKRNWAYCAAILKRWAVEGKTASPTNSKPSGRKHPTSIIPPGESVGDFNRRVVQEMVYGKS